MSKISLLSVWGKERGKEFFNHSQVNTTKLKEK
jgi:hypothetical protein